MANVLTFGTTAQNIIIMDIPRGKNLFCSMNNHCKKKCMLAKVFRTLSVYMILNTDVFGKAFYFQYTKQLCPVFMMGIQG